MDGQYQRAAAERAVRYLSGVRGVTNLIAIKAAVRPKEIKMKIEQALARSAALDAQKINVDQSSGRWIAGDMWAHAH